MMSYMVENDEANKDFFDRRDLTTISIIEEVSNPFESKNIDTFELIESGSKIVEKSQKKAKTDPCSNLFFSSSGLFGTSFNFINSIIGSGVIGMPYAFNQSGIGITFVLFFIVGFLTDYSILRLISNGQKTGTRTYQDLVYFVMGNVGYYFLVSIQFLYPFISLISYHIIIGDTVSKVLKRLFKISVGSVFSNRLFIIFVISLCVTLPLSLLRNISRLAKTSFISCLLIFIVLFVMVFRMFSMKDSFPIDQDKFKLVKNFYGITDSFSIMAFAFMCHHNSFLIFNSMSKPNMSNWKKVTHSSIIFSTSFSIMFGVVGFLTFGSLTQGDVFENYCHKDDLMNVIRLFYAIIIMFSYPLECFVCREVIENTFFHQKKGNKKLHTIITIAITMLTMLLSFTTDCLGVVLELNGALVATSLAYIIPSICTIMVNYRIERQLTAHVIVPSLIGVFGLVVLISGLISVVNKIRNGYECSHGSELAYCSMYNLNISFSNSTRMFYSYNITNLNFSLLADRA